MEFIGADEQVPREVYDRQGLFIWAERARIKKIIGFRAYALHGYSYRELREYFEEYERSNQLVTVGEIPTVIPDDIGVDVAVFTAVVGP